METYKYIELNPLRAGMVKDPSDYHWSSYQINALGIISELCTPHDQYLKLGKNDKDRQENDRALLKNEIESEILTEIRSNTNKGHILHAKPNSN